MDRRRKVWAAGFLAAAIVALMVLAAALPRLQFHAGAPFSLPGSAAGAAGQPFGSGGVSIIFLIVRGLLALAVIGLPIYIVISLLTAGGRRRLLGDTLALVLIVLALTLLSRSAQAPLDQKALNPGLLATPPPAATPAPEAHFVAQVPPWLDVVAAPALAVVISAAVAAALWWAWRRADRIPRPASERTAESPPDDTLDRVAAQAQQIVDALRAGEAVEDAVIRSYVELGRVVLRERAIQREEAMTPHEFEQLLVRRGFPPQPVRDLTRLFERVRYGNRPAGETDERQAIASLEAIIAFCRGGGA